MLKKLAALESSMHVDDHIHSLFAQKHLYHIAPYFRQKVPGQYEDFKKVIDKRTKSPIILSTENIRHIRHVARINEYGLIAQLGA